MIKRWIKKYFSIVFVLAMFVGVLHHHDTLQVHNDCQICVIQSNIVDIDTPIQSTYLTDIELKSYSPLTEFKNLQNYKKYQKLQARAPPVIS